MAMSYLAFFERWNKTCYIMPINCYLGCAGSSVAVACWWQAESRICQCIHWGYCYCVVNLQNSIPAVQPAQLAELPLEYWLATRVATRGQRPLRICCDACHLWCQPFVVWAKLLGRSSLRGWVKKTIFSHQKVSLFGHKHRFFAGPPMRLFYLPTFLF